MNADSELKSSIATCLKSHGFRKKGLTWFRDSNDVIWVVNLQRSQFGLQHYLNVGIWMKSLGGEEPFPKENKCHLRTRLSKLVPSDIGMALEKSLDLENEDVTSSERQEGIKKTIESYLVPIILDLASMNDLKIAFGDGKIDRFHIKKKAATELKR